ncbi:HdeD family acid-resistance protein [Nucisporomicrobium flavum]|uniref:HdeD family acid-resistance protein n=1 Tax=Nucisporomicrobium flavum TaxID=2785915 RepID=UPI003C2E3B95
MTTIPEQPLTPAAPENDGRAATRLPTIPPHQHWLRLVAGLLAIAVGVAAFAWPEATLRVVAVLFGLNLVLTGFLRAGLLLFAPGHPMLNRVLGIVFGVLTGLIGLLCLRNLTASLAVLIAVVAVGWLLDGLVQLVTAIGARGEKGSRWQLATAALMMAGAVVVLIWPKLGLGAFIFIGATVLVFCGIGMTISGIAGMRADHRATG